MHAREEASPRGPTADRLRAIFDGIKAGRSFDDLGVTTEEYSALAAIAAEAKAKRAAAAAAAKLAELRRLQMFAVELAGRDIRFVARAAHAIAKGREPTKSKSRRAEDALREVLANGPRAVVEVQREVIARVGCSSRTIERARLYLGVVSHRERRSDGKIGRFVLELPKEPSP